MRLLEFSNGKFCLTGDLLEQKVPKYAILSHTWGADTEEVTFRDVVDGIGENKTGWEKIRFCADQARRHGLRYFWVDTCCINKSDNNELSKSINSMFRWYQNSAQCYVYLSGIYTTGPGGIQRSLSDIVQGPAFRSHQWFTRGWTLQELLAPSSVEFYTQDGYHLGDKGSLEQQISEITGISVSALRGTTLSLFSIQERFKWAETRQTTHEEDWAYCLLGIFGIFMPLIYGEGKDHAIRRLRREITDATNRVENNLGSRANNAIRIVPFGRNPSFTSREAELRRLRKLLFSDRGTPKVAIAGLGGVGKTQLVLELLHQIMDEHPDWSVVWVPATSKEALEQTYLKVAQEFGIAGFEGPNADVKSIVQGYLSGASAGRWLLVFDNADDIDMWLVKPPGKTRRLIDYLPKSNQGSIVFTTRDKKAAIALAGQNTMQLSEMDEAGSRELLRNHLVDTTLKTQEEEETMALLARLTYLPLAIVQAATYINANGIDLSDYLSLLDEQEEDVIELLSENFEDETRYTDVNDPVATTWLISFEQIRQRDPLAADYLCLMACVEPKDIPQALLPPGTSRKRETDALGTLQAYSFITARRSSNSTLTIHRLVHLATRNWLRKEGMLFHWTHTTSTRLQDVLGNVDRSNRDQWKPYMSHIYHVIVSGYASEDNGCNLSKIYGHCLTFEGRYWEAEVFFERVAERDTRILGADHVTTLVSKSNIASSYCNQCEWKKAEALCNSIREPITTNPFIDVVDKICSLRDLARARWYLDRRAEAAELYAQRLEMAKEALGDDHYVTLNCANDLAFAYEGQGRNAEAQRLDEHTIEVTKLRLGLNHLTTLFSMRRMTRWHLRNGRWEEAEKLITHVVEAQKANLGTHHPDTLSSTGELAKTWMGMGRREEALVMLQGCVDSLRQVMGPDYRYTVYWARVLAEWQEGDYSVTKVPKRVGAADEQEGSYFWLSFIKYFG